MVAVHTRARALADDARQDVALHFLSHALPGEVAADPGRLAAYLRGAVRRRLISLRRREQRHAHGAFDESPAAAPDRAARDRLAERVHAVLARMRAGGEGTAADLLDARFLERRTVESLAAGMGKSSRAVSAQLQRAKQKFLAAWLASGGGGLE